MPPSLKPQKWDALILSYAEWLHRTEPQTVLTDDLDEDGNRIRLFGSMVEPWSEVRAEIRRLRELQGKQEAA
jgi:hypothetical protein